MDKTETIIGSQEQFRGRMLRVRIATVRLSDGREAKREIVDRNSSACVVALTDSGDVFFVRQFRPAIGKELLELPAGTIDGEELPEACAARELEEETGYRASRIIPVCGIYASPGYSSEKIYAFLATGLKPGVAHLDADEELEVETIPYARIEEMIRTGEIEDGKSVAALLAAGPYIRNELWLSE